MTSIETTTASAGADAITNLGEFEVTKDSGPTHRVAFVLVAPFSDPASWFFLQRELLQSLGLRAQIADGSGAEGVGGSDFTYRLLFDVTAPEGGDLLIATAPGLPEDGWTVTISSADGEEQAVYTLPADKHAIHSLT